MPVCLALAQTLVAMLPTNAFTLIWTHSVEKTEWREEWRVENDRLRLTEAMVEGSGAGMEPPSGAVRAEGGWLYVPNVPPMQRLVLAHSNFGGGYRLCWSGTCRPLANLLPPGSAGAVELYPCDIPSLR